MAKGKRGKSDGKVAAQRAEERQKLPLTQRRRKRMHAEELATSLQRERDMLEVIMETTSTQIAYLDADFKFIKVNSAYASGSGHAAEELIGKNHFAFFPDPENQAIFEKVRDTGEPVRYAAKPFVYADQPERGVTYWDWTLSPVKDNSGCVQGLVLSLADVTEQTRAEEVMRRSARELAVRNQIVDIFLTVADDEMYGEVLQVILEAMESRYGIFGYIGDDGSLVIPSMTRDIWDVCQVPGKTIVYPRETWGGIWGRALRNRKSLYANAGLSVPEGHIPITRVLVIPIVYRGKAIGLLEVANRATDYGEEDRQFLETIAGHMAPILDARLERDRREKERKRAEEALRERTHDLDERVNQLGCLYGISRLVEQSGISVEELLREAVELIPPAWRYPEVACARIILEDQEFRTGNFRESNWRQTADIIVFGQRLGAVEVCYVEERPGSDEGPFQKEERSLINAIAERLGRVTERKRAEQTIRQQAAFLQTILDALRDPFYVVDAEDYSIKMANAAARLGRSPKATTCYALTHGFSEPCTGDEHVCPLQVVKETKAPVTVEHIHRDADGNDRPVEVHCHPVLDDEGKVKQVIEYTLDITERRRAEEELERLRREFLGMVTHELKTPLTAIKGSAATALGSRRPFDSQENRELFQIVDEQADRLRDLVDNLLDMTRIEAGSLSISPEPTDLRAVLEEARATFVRSGGSHEVQLELADDLPAVAADRHRTVQVLTNLLNNAARFSPATELITIAVEHDPLEVAVHVRDRGRGIPREKLPRLFKKFSQVHDDTGQKLSGSGLGLAICKGIVEAHGGRIWVDSAGEGQGSTFSFTLPVATETRVRALSDEARRTLHMGRVRRPGERTRVLAVDDEPQVLRYLQRALDEAGYQAILTSDPSQVAKLVELEEPDLVLLDLRLPETSGFDLLQRIRDFSGVPVIFLTASDRDEDTVRALRMGADDYITKPFSPSELLARIEAALRRRLLPDLMEAQPPFVLGDLTINFAERRVAVGGQAVSLSATEYKILYELATHADRVLTYDQILHRVWGEEYSGETQLVRSFIRNLRRKLGDDAQQPRFIVTERQVGYRMLKP
jgi:PAS domain S-box-containing protein